jgi:hypothetical protein
VRRVPIKCPQLEDERSNVGFAQQLVLLALVAFGEPTHAKQPGNTGRDHDARDDRDPPFALRAPRSRDELHWRPCDGTTFGPLAI